MIFGGVGAGLYGMLLYAIVSVFIAGLMVGRTPEYIGKKIQQKEVKMAFFAILATSFLILVFAGISIVTPFVTRVREPNATSTRNPRKAMAAGVRTPSDTESTALRDASPRVRSRVSACR